jgi:hypothetical protein
MPDDFSKHPDFSIVGTIDNGRFLELVARALVRERMQHVWQNQVLNPTAFPLGYHFFKKAVISAQQKIWFLGPLVARACGFTSKNFPHGPSVFIALTPVVEGRIERASKFVFENLQAESQIVFEASSWRELASHPKIKTLVARGMESFEKLYRQRDEAAAFNRQLAGLQEP